MIRWLRDYARALGFAQQARARRHVGRVGHRTGTKSARTSDWSRRQRHHALALARSEDLAVVGGQHPIHQGNPQIHIPALFCSPLVSPARVRHVLDGGVGNGTDEEVQNYRKRRIATKKGIV